MFYEELAVSLDLSVESPLAEIAEDKGSTEEDRARGRERWHRNKRKRQLEATL
jgi:hypothetical protein